MSLRKLCNGTYLFNHDDIQEVVSSGYKDEEERAFQQNILSKVE
nr:DUF4176 domain-containing protein [Bacillus thuringiensis]